MLPTLTPPLLSVHLSLYLQHAEVRSILGISTNGVGAAEPSCWPRRGGRDRLHQGALFPVLRCALQRTDGAQSHRTSISGREIVRVLHRIYSVY